MGKSQQISGLEAHNLQLKGERDQLINNSKEASQQMQIQLDEYGKRMSGLADENTHLDAEKQLLLKQVQTALAERSQQLELTTKQVIVENQILQGDIDQLQMNVSSFQKDN